MTLDNATRQAAAPEGFRPYAGILVECGDLIRNRATEALQHAVNEIDDELQRRRESTRAPEESLRLIEAQYQLRAAGAQLGRQFSTAFAQRFQQRAKPSARQDKVYGEGSGFRAELSLVDDEEITDNLTVQNLANQLRMASESELQQLQPRIAFMLGKDELDAASDPLGPTAICETLKDVCWSLEGSRETRDMLLELLVQHLGNALTPIFKEINSLLVSRKVLPDGRARPKRGSAIQRLQARHRQNEEAVGDEQPNPGEVIQQLFSPRGAPQRQAASQGGAESPELMQLLTRLQRGESQVALGDDAFSLIPDAPGTANVLSMLLESGLGKHVGSVNEIVINVVATLFDYIFDDDRVPAAMKGLIGRLQIPVLKLAMMDHGFFSNRNHPARKLINELAQAASTWDGELSADSSLYRTAEAIVLRVQNEFADDAAVFSACLQSFEDYLGEQERHADERAATLTGRLEERERQEIARTIASNAIAVHLADERLPTAVRDFLGGPWLKVLIHASMHGGEDGKPWAQATSTMDELVWSVMPKHGAEDRQRLVQRLPILLRGLKAGLGETGLDEPSREAFFTELVKLHALAVKSGMTPESTAHSDATKDGDAPLGGDGDPVHRPPAKEAQPESIELDLLGRGSWIELTDETGQVRKVRLTWISPARTMYLFANRQGQRALALTSSELTRRLSSGEASVVDGGALLDRIVDNVIDEFQG